MASTFKELAEELKTRNTGKNTERTSKKVNAFQLWEGSKLGLDTFEDDLRSMGETISGIYSGWQTPETMRNTRGAVQAMSERVSAYQKYQNKYGLGNDISDLVSGYQSVLDDWDDLTARYGYYQNADAYDAALKQVQLKQQFAGKSYDEVQELKKQYAEDSDEYKYLSEYLGYTDLREFDKAIEAEKNSVEEVDLGEVIPKGQGALKTPEYATNPLMEQVVANTKVIKSANEAYLKELETARNQYALDNTFDLYRDYMNAEDFEELAQYKSTKSGKWHSGLTSQYGMGYDDAIYEYINNVDGIRDTIERKATVFGRDSGNTTSAIEKKGYNKLNEDEIAVYNYIYATEGKDKAQEFLDAMEVTLTKRVYDETTKRWENAADSGVIPSVVMSALSVPANIAGAVSSTVDTVADSVMGKEYNPYDYDKMLSNFAADTRSYVGENIAQETKGMELLGQNVPSFLYQTGMSIADSAVGAATMGRAFAPIMGTSAFQQKAKELKEAGENEDTIMAAALASGVAETAFEYISLDRLLKIKNVDDVEKLIKQTLKQAGVEGFEEFCTEVANVISDTAIRGESSELYQMYEELKARGFSEGEINAKIALQVVSQIGWASLGGILSGASMGGVSSAANYRNLKNTGAEIRANERVQETLELAGLTPEEYEAYKLYTEYAGKGLNADTVTNAQLGNLYATTAKEAHRNTAVAGELERIATPKTAEEREHEQRVNGLNTGEVTEVSATGNSAKIEGIRTEDGETVLLTSEGEVPAKDMTLSQNDAELVAYAEGMSEEKANIFISQYDGKSDVKAFARSFELVYMYGETGSDADSVLANKGVLTERQALEVYKGAMKAQVSARQAAVDEITKKYSNLVTKAGTIDDSVIDYESQSTDENKINWNSLTANQRFGISYAIHFAQATGMNLEVFKGKNGAENGTYDPSTNTVRINAYAGYDTEQLTGAILPAVSHETTHWMEAKAPAVYREMQEVILNTLAKDSKYTLGHNLSVEDLIAYEQNRIKQAHPELGEVSKEYAINEIVARACEDMLSGSEKAKQMIAELSPESKKTLADKIREVLSNIKSWINEMLSKYKSKSREAEAMRRHLEEVNKLQELWDKALEEAVNTNNALREENVKVENTDRTKYSYAGREALTADTDARYKAIQMEIEGKSEKEIFIETGWFRGADKKWRFEIDDSEAKIYYQGDALWQGDPLYKEYLQLQEDAFWGEDYDEKRHEELKRIFDTHKTVKTVRDYLAHNKLFEAYPFIANLRVVIKKLPAGAKGVYIAEHGTVELSEELFGEYTKSVLKRTLLHELQHVIQHYERFAAGASPDTWKDVDIKEKQYKYELAMKQKKEAFAGGTEEFKNLIRKLNRLQLDENFGEEYDRIENELYAKYEDRYNQYDNALFEARLYADSESLSDFIKYQMTAGEIEARDVANRADWTAERRMDNMPVRETEVGVIFAENKKSPFEYQENIRYSDSMDSEGNPLSAEQVEFFKDSKVRDENGKLMVVYHGTRNYGFTIFDTINDAEYGSHFGTKESAGEFSDDMYKAYLNITNPITLPDIFGANYKLADYVNYLHGCIDRLIGGGNVATDIGRNPVKRINNVSELPINAAFEEYSRMATDWVYGGSAEGAVEVSKKAQEYLMSLGYDGVIYTNEYEGKGTTSYMVFNPNQIKNTDNKKPTNDMDIRYSDGDTNGFGLAKYTEKEIENWSNSNILYANSEQDIINYVENHVKTGENTRLYCGKISSSIADRIKKDTGYDLENYNVSITSSFENSHADEASEALLGQIAMTPNEVAKFPYVISDYDIVTFGGVSKENNPVLKFEKVINGRKIAVTYILTKRRMLKLQTIYGWAEKKNHLTATDASMTDANARTSMTNSDTDSNNIVSQSEKNATDETIRFSDAEIPSIYEVVGENEALKKQNAKLAEDVARLAERLKLEKKVTGENTFDEKQLRSVAEYLLRFAQSTYSEAGLIEQLREIYTYIVKTPALEWDDLMAKCYEVAKGILNKQRGTKVTNDYFKGILSEIRGTRISLSEEQIQEAKNVFGDRYRDAFMGRVILAKDGISLDQKWQEWSTMYPEIFDADITGGNQIIALSDIYENLREASEVYQIFGSVEDIRALANEIYNQYWNVSTIRTTADKYDKQIKELNFKHRQMMSELRAENKKKLENQRIADDIHYKRIINNIRQQNETKVREAKESGRRRLDEHRDRAARNAKIQSITKKALQLNRWLVKNSKEEHIPEVLKEPVVYLLKAIDFSSRRLLGVYGGNSAYSETRKDISLSKALEKVHNMVVDINSANIDESKIDAVYGTYIDIPNGFAEDVQKLSGEVNDIVRAVGDNAYVLNQMTFEELEVLDKIVTTMKTTVSKMNKFLAIRHAEGVASLSKQSMTYMDSLGKIIVRDGVTGAASKLLNWGNSLPFYVFKRYGEGGQKVYEALQNGWDAFAFHIKEIIDYAENTYTSKEVKEWGATIKDFDILVPATEDEMLQLDYEPSYQKIQMSIPQIMSLYCLQKREQAKGHLLGGGIRVTDIKTKNGIISQSEGVLLSEEELTRIIGSLTDRQRVVADALQLFMNTTCTEWGNKVSMLRFGYKAFGEENYFPLQSDKNNLAVNDETEQNNSLFRLLNMSFTKSTIEKANNRIVISDIFDVFAQHTSDMAKYNALALPVLDAFKWYNYKVKSKKGETQFTTKSLKQSMESAFGKDGQNYFVTFLKDINGADNVGRDSIAKGFFSNAKIASVGFNLRVVALQPTSYVRASAVINPKYLTMAFTRKPKIDRAQKYCGIALWKSLGFYDTNIQRGVTELIKHDETTKDKIVDASMKGAEIADKVTWGYLWNACELEIKDTRTDLSVGTEEFYEEVGKRLREIIYSTQVVDSTMTRSQMMRSNATFDKMLTNFASEPTLAYNMLQDCYYDWKLTERQTGSAKKAFHQYGNKMARVFVAYTVTNMLCALVEAGFDIFRDDEEKEPEEMAELLLKNFALDMSILNKIPYAKETVSMLQGYSSSRTDTQWLQYLTYTYSGFKKLLEGEGNAYTTLKNAMRAFSYGTGLPVYNVWRDSAAVLDKTEILTAEELEELINDTLGQIFPSLKSK